MTEDDVVQEAQLPWGGLVLSQARTADYGHVVKTHQMLRPPCRSAIDVDRVLPVRVDGDDALLGCLVTGCVPPLEGVLRGHRVREPDWVASVSVEGRRAGVGPIGRSGGAGGG